MWIINSQFSWNSDILKNLFLSSSTSPTPTPGQNWSLLSEIVIGNFCSFLLSFQGEEPARSKSLSSPDLGSSRDNIARNPLVSGGFAPSTPTGALPLDPIRGPLAGPWNPGRERRQFHFLRFAISRHWNDIVLATTLIYIYIYIVDTNSVLGCPLAKLRGPRVPPYRKNPSYATALFITFRAHDIDMYRSFKFRLLFLFIYTHTQLTCILFRSQITQTMCIVQ